MGSRGLRKRLNGFTAQVPTNVSDAYGFDMFAASVITKAPREGASFITSQVIRAVGGGGGGVGQNSWVFPAIPHLELEQNPVAKGACFGPDFGPLG